MRPARIRDFEMRKVFLCFCLFLALGFTNKALGFDGGSGTEAEPYLISTPEHLVELFFHLGNEHFKLLNDIDLTNYLAVGGAGHNDGAGWNPIGNASNKFSGTLNGAGFKITGLWIDRSSTDYVGLFGHIDGTINNIGVEIATTGLKGNSYVGGLAGYCSGGTVIDCYVTGKVSGINDRVGGLIGRASSCIINNCYATGYVSGINDRIGGLIGEASNIQITDCYTANIVNGKNRAGGLIGEGSLALTITNCHATGNVSGIYNDIGGLIGNATEGPGAMSITNCYATGNVIGYDDVGGLVGASHASITYCHATGNVEGNNNVGGLKGRQTQGSYNNNCYATGNVRGNDNVGGLIGYLEYTSHTKCYATGNVNGINNVGGLVGASSGSSLYGRAKFTNCYTILATVIGDTRVGGLIGTNGYEASVSNCYTSCNVNGNTSVGGFIGRNGGTVENSFFDYQTTGQIYAVGDGSGTTTNLLGKSTAEMKTKSTFISAEWDFTTIWGIDEGITYPFFIDEPVAINEPMRNIKVQVYPNPTNGELRIESRELKIKSLEFFDVYGKNIRINTHIFPENSGNEIVINISHLSAGVYFVKVSTESGEIVKKVLKE